LALVYVSGHRNPDLDWARWRRRVATGDVALRIRRNVLAQVDFVPEIAEPLKTMPAEIFPAHIGVVCTRRSPRKGDPISSSPGEDPRVSTRTTDDGRKVTHAR
jgi:hypothetical protein